MAKYYGKIGYIQTAETSPGVWTESVTERNYYGELVSNRRSISNASQVNDNIDISNQISILSDPYANENFHNMRYAEFMGTKWRVTSVDVQYPRLILTLGGIWNGE